MARTGLTDLIATLRTMCDAGTGDYTLGTAIYWDANQLQYVLDRHRLDVFDEELAAIPQEGGGTVNYYIWTSRWGNYEQTTGGTAVFYISDVKGNKQGTANFTIDYSRGLITFPTSQWGTAYYLTGRSYDLDAAAAEIWRTKASHSAKAYNITTDNHTLNRSQIMAHCLQMAAYFDQQAGARTAIVDRGDMTPGGWQKDYD